MFSVPRLSRTRMAVALGIALIADGVQIALGPLGWTFIDEIIDVITMALMTWILGFHLLLLPTFLVEFIPVIDMLPTWTGCVAAVIALRKREQSNITVTVPPIIESNLPPQITAGEPDQGTRPR